MGWIDSLKREAESTVTDLMMKFASSRFPSSTPKSKEEYMYRDIFSKHFPSPGAAGTVPQAKSSRVPPLQPWPGTRPGLWPRIPPAALFPVYTWRLTRTNRRCEGRLETGTGIQILFLDFIVFRKMSLVTV